MTDWNAIIGRHQATLWRTAYRLLNHYDDALDCCQDALLDACQYASRHRVEEWGAVLTCLVTRRAIDRLRQRVRTRRHVVSLNGVAEPPAGCGGPVQNAEASEALERIRGLLAELSEKQATVFWLGCVEGMSHERIGQQLAISANESRVLLHRARAFLESGLQSHRTHAGEEQ
jgi:RNA polymerase sigma factor (sigma-70 family)